MHLGAAHRIAGQVACDHIPNAAVDQLWAGIKDQGNVCGKNASRPAMDGVDKRAGQTKAPKCRRASRPALPCKSIKDRFNLHFGPHKLIPTMG
jgi:hypothetical protein